MAANLVTRRTTLKFAGTITLAASCWRELAGRAAISAARGYGTDPDLLKRNVTWPRTLSQFQITTLQALSDIVLPAEPPHPSAGALGVHDFLDEWLSAPYPRMQADREVILSGLNTLDKTAIGEFGVTFVSAGFPQKISVFDNLCGSEASVLFSRRLIELVCAGYYTTREGHAAIGYVGNVALVSFPGPPARVVRHLEAALDDLLRSST